MPAEGRWNRQVPHPKDAVWVRNRHAGSEDRPLRSREALKEPV